MNTDPFLDPRSAPPEEALIERIGRAFTAVSSALRRSGTSGSPITRSWKFSRTSGWYVTYDRGKKRLFYLFPKPSGLLIRMVFNEKGMTALRNCQDLPANVMAQIKKPRTYPEGTLIELTKATASSKTLHELLLIKIHT